MAETGTTFAARELGPADLEAVVRIDAAHTGLSKERYWRRVFAGFVQRPGKEQSFGLGVDADGALVGYLFGEVRAVEFGAEPAGWVFAVGVEPARQGQGIARTLLQEAKRRFRALGVRHLRTMVRRNDVSILSFFRTAGFVGGPFVQLEIDLEEGA